MATRKPAKPRTESEKLAAFKDGAEKAVTTILRGFAKIGRMGNAKKYSHTPDQRKAMQTAISDAAESAFKALEGKAAASSGFKFG